MGPHLQPSISRRVLAKVSTSFTCSPLTVRAESTKMTGSSLQRLSDSFIDDRRSQVRHIRAS